MNFEYQNFGLGSDLGKIRLIGIMTVLVLIATGILCALLLSGSEASIMADSSDESLFTTKNIEDFNVKFGYKQDPQVMIFERENVGIGIKIPFENIVWEKIEDSIQASSGDYVFRYSIIKDREGNSVGIKEDIILSKKPEQTNFEFPINLKNLSPQRIKDIWRFFDKNNTEQFYIPKPFMIDAKGERSEEVEIEIVDNKIIVLPNKDWLDDSERAYPVMIDPSFMITILNVHSHPQAGDYWTVSFETIGTANLTIAPADQQSIDDLDFISLTCDGEERNPQIKENDVIFYSDWSCDGIGEIVHLVNIEAPHILKFQFSDQVAFAYNSPGGGDISFQNLALDNLKTEKHAEAGGDWSCGDDITDSRDDKVYGTVQIGDQCWLKKSMNIGTMVNFSGGTQTDNDSIEKWCFEDNEDNCELDGGTYTWDEAMEYSTTTGTQGICPSGWHIPTLAESCTLRDEVDSGSPVCEVGDEGSVDGGTSLKEGGASGFEFRLAGFWWGFRGGSWSSHGSDGCIWLSTLMIDDTSAHTMKVFLTGDHSSINGLTRATFGIQVRCIQD